MDRRTFLGSGAALWIGAAYAADTPRRIPRIGFLTGNTALFEDSFWQELRRLGYVRDSSISVDYRSANGDFNRLPELAAALVAGKPDLIVASVTQASLAARGATSTIPIVMVSVSDPVASGLVVNLARPGGNVTGTSTPTSDVIGKQLDLIREVRPGIARVAALRNPANVEFQRQQSNEARAAALKLNLTLKLFDARTEGELSPAFAALAKERPQALLVLSDPVFNRNATAIAKLAIKHRLPLFGGTRVYAEAGALATYGPDFTVSWGRAATYVDRILKGARPADLPVEQSAKFDLVINMATAKVLGITIAQALLLRADEVIR